MYEFMATLFVGGRTFIEFACPFTNITIERETVTFRVFILIRWLIRTRVIRAQDTREVRLTRSRVRITLMNGNSYDIEGSNNDDIMRALIQCGFPTWTR
jgi:hypothetical protein